MLRNWKPDELNYFTFLPLDICNLVHNMMMCDLITQIVKSLYQPQPDWSDEYGNTEEWYIEVLEREIEIVFDRHSIPIKLEYKKEPCIVNLTFHDNVSITDQVIADVILIRNRFYHSDITPQLNTLLRRYNMPFRIVEHEDTTHHGCTEVNVSVIPVS